MATPHAVPASPGWKVLAFDDQGTIVAELPVALWGVTAAGDAVPLVLPPSKPSRHPAIVGIAALAQDHFKAHTFQLKAP